MTAAYDRIPRDWTGETAVIIAGGPSLTQAQVDATRGRAKVVAINNAVYMAPWADVLWFCDRKWWIWHEQAVRAFRGEVWTLENLSLRHEMPALRCVCNAGAKGWDDGPDCLRNGRNSGYQAISLAAKRGAGRILLLGFDMRAIDGRCHWHDEHETPSTPKVYAETMLPHFPALGAALAAKGVEVVNCTPGSALTVWPQGEIECALAS